MSAPDPEKILLRLDSYAVTVFLEEVHRQLEDAKRIGTEAQINV